MEGLAPIVSEMRPRKPALLKGGMVVCWIYAGVLALFLAMFPRMKELAATNASAGARMPGFPRGAPISLQAEFLDATRVFIVPLLVLSIAIAYGLARDRHWSRWLTMVLLVLGVVLIPPQLANPVNYTLSVAFALFGWWYLYKKKNVVGYYRSIRNSDGADLGVLPESPARIEQHDRSAESDRPANADKV